MRTGRPRPGQAPTGALSTLVLVAALAPATAQLYNECERNTVCRQAGQQCFDPSIYWRGDWFCYCDGDERWGLEFNRRAICRAFTFPKPAVDECTVCPQEARAKHNGNLEYNGAAVVNIPLTSLEECERECTRRDDCVAYTYNRNMDYAYPSRIGNCIAAQACCFIYDTEHQLTRNNRDEVVSGMKDYYFPCAVDDRGVNTCERAQQVCVDPTAGEAVYGDWQCRCAPPKVGTGVAALARKCQDLFPDIAVDECATCPEVARGTYNNRRYTGFTPFAGFDGLTLDQCADQCTRAPSCRAFTHSRVTIDPDAAADCVAGRPCCLLFSEVGSRTRQKDATSGLKVPFTPCAVDNAGRHTCLDGDQECADPSAGSSTLGDWLCVCKSPRTGVGRAAPATCVMPTGDHTPDECAATPSVASVTAPGMRYAGGAFTNIPDLNASSCADACTRSEDCEAFTHEARLDTQDVDNNCVRGRSCCWMINSTYIEVLAMEFTSGVKRPVEPSAIDPANNENLCVTHGQMCVDPSSGDPVYGDWQCRCIAPAYGAAVGMVVPACRALSPLLSIDECAGSSDVVLEAALQADTALIGIADAEDTIPGLSVDACRRECTRRAGCRAFTHYTADALAVVLGPALQGNCYQGAVCCAVTNASSAASPAASKGATSGAKTRFEPCAIQEVSPGPGMQAWTICDEVVQTCYDPTAGGGMDTLGDWLCRCVTPEYGVGVGQEALCGVPVPPLEVDECLTCPRVAAAGDDHAIVGGQLVDIPDVTAKHCAAECTRTPPCEGFTFANSSAAPLAAPLHPQVNCIGAEACCWLHDASANFSFDGVLIPGVVVGHKAAVASCDGLRTGDEICDAQVAGDAYQACLDPTAGTEVFEDWQCRCADVGPDKYFGVNTTGRAACQLRAPPLTADECDTPVRVALVTDRDTLLDGGDVLNIPLLTLDECALECTRVDECDAFTFDEAPLAEWDGNCIPEASCCWLKNASHGNTSHDGLTSGLKLPTSFPDAIDDNGVNICEDAGQVCIDRNPAALGDWLCACALDNSVTAMGTVVAVCPTPVPPPTPVPTTVAPPPPPPTLAPAVDYLLDECITVCPTCENATCAVAGQACHDRDNSSLSLNDWECACIDPYQGTAVVGGPAQCRLKTVLPPEVIETIDRTTKTGGLISITTGSGKLGISTGTIGKLAILKNFNCFIEDVDLEHSEPLDFEFHPFGVGIGPERIQYFIGACVCNVLMVVGFSTLFAGVATLFHYCAGVRWQKAFGWVRSPGITYIPYLFALSGTSLSSCHIMFYSSGLGLGYVLFGGGLLLFTVATPLVVYFKVLRRVAVLAAAVQDMRLCHQPLAKKENDEDKEHAEALNDTKTIGKAPAKRVEVYTGWRRSLYYFTFGSVIWVARDGCPASDLWFCEMYGVIFEGFRVDKVWVVLVEIVSILALSLLASVKPSTSAMCHVRNTFICLAMFVFLLVLIRCRPYTAPLDNFVAVALAAMVFVCVVLLSVALAIEAEQDDMVLSSAGQLMLYSAILVEAKAVWDLVTYLVDIYLERRSGARKQARQQQQADAAGADPLKQLREKEREVQRGHNPPIHHSQSGGLSYDDLPCFAVDQLETPSPHTNAAAAPNAPGSTSGKDSFNSAPRHFTPAHTGGDTASYYEPQSFGAPLLMDRLGTGATGLMSMCDSPRSATGATGPLQAAAEPPRNANANPLLSTKSATGKSFALGAQGGGKKKMLGGGPGSPAGPDVSSPLAGLSVGNRSLFAPAGSPRAGSGQGAAGLLARGRDAGMPPLLGGDPRRGSTRRVSTGLTDTTRSLRDTDIQVLAVDRDRPSDSPGVPELASTRAGGRLQAAHGPPSQSAFATPDDGSGSSSSDKDGAPAATKATPLRPRGLTAAKSLFAVGQQRSAAGGILGVDPSAGGGGGDQLSPVSPSLAVSLNAPPAQAVRSPNGSPSRPAALALLTSQGGGGGGVTDPPNPLLGSFNRTAATLLRPKGMGSPLGASEKSKSQLL